MKTVAIVGVGLIGGSFGLALRKSGFAGEILGVSSQAAIQAAIAVGAIDRAVPLEEAVQADLIYLAQPIDRILKTIEVLGPIAPSGCLITDAGSTKLAIVRQAASHLRRAHFLGGHPMAGKETRGVQSAEADLFADRPYVLTPLESALGDLESDLILWLGRIGARVLMLPPERHDEAVAWSSHLPQLLSTALGYTLSRAANPDVELVAGPGLMDMTRLAMSSPDLWKSILATNRGPILLALGTLVEQLTGVKSLLEEDRLLSLWEESSTFARNLRQTPT